MSEDLKLNALQRIAAALERLAAHFDGDVMAELAASRPGNVIYTPPAAVTGTQALIDMPNDIPAAPEPDPVSKDDVIKALNECGRRSGLPAAKKILSGFGATLADVDPAKYGQLIDALKTPVNA